MKRSELEDAIRVAAELIRQDQFLIIGSQAILGSYTEDELPELVTMSQEVDIATWRDAGSAEAADRISMNAGELSEFHQAHGFYLEGVQRETAILPPDWEYRLVSVRNEATRNATGLCLDPHDLCAAKLMAHREKDFEFVSMLIEHGIIDPSLIGDRLSSIDLDNVHSDQSRQQLEHRRLASLQWADSWQQKLTGAQVHPDGLV